jgi:hypothetical protein
VWRSKELGYIVCSLGRRAESAEELHNVRE